MDRDASELDILQWRLKRRALLRGAVLGGVGLGAAALIGCDDDDDDDDDGGGAAATPTQAGATSTPTQAAATDDGSGSVAGVDPPGDYVKRAAEDGAPFPYNFPEPATTPKKGGTLDLSVVWDFVTWDPGLPAAQTMPLNFVGDRLVGYATGPLMDKWQNRLQPEIARGWEISPDGLTYTFDIAQGVKFHNIAPVNGRGLTAQDVVAVYTRYQTEGRYTNLLEDVTSMTAPDDNTVTMTVKGPSPDFLDGLATVMVIYAPELADQGLLDDALIGTGPAMMDEVQKGNFVKLKSNPDYWRGTPHLDGVEFRITPDQAARLAAFRVEQVAHAFYVPNVVLGANALLDSNPDTQIIVDPILATVWTWGFNLTTDKFKDDRVRQAISLGFDRNKVIELVYGGFARYPTALMWPFVWDEFPTDDQIGPWHHQDPTEARKLLSAAGQEGFEFELAYTPGHGEASDNENQIMKDDLVDAGITVNLNSVDRTAFTALFNSSPPSYPEAASGGFAPAVTPTGFYADSITTGSPQNYWNLSDPKIDELAEKQKRELDPDARRELLRQIWDIEGQRALRLGKSREFLLTAFQPWLRYYRFNAAAVSMHWAGHWGLGFHNAWIDK